MSGKILLYKAHDIDSTRDPTFRDVTGHEKVNAVPHDNSVLHAVTRLIEWDAFDAAVKQHGTIQPRGFTYKNHLLTLLYAQFTDARSLRHIEGGLNGHAARLYHLGAAPVSRSTLADANRDRPAAGVFRSAGRHDRSRPAACGARWTARPT